MTILYQSFPELTNPNFPGEFLFAVMKISFLHVNSHTKKAQGKGRGIAFVSLEQKRLGRRGITASRDGADLGTVSLSLTQISKPDLLSS